MEVIRETLWKRCLSTPIKPPAKNSNICLSETAYQHKETRKKCKKTNQASIIQWQRQCLMYKPHRKPSTKSKTSDISKQSPSPLHPTFLLGCARFTAQPYQFCSIAMGLRPRTSLSRRFAPRGELRYKPYKYKNTQYIVVYTHKVFKIGDKRLVMIKLI